MVDEAVHVAGGESARQREELGQDIDVVLAGLAANDDEAARRTGAVAGNEHAGHGPALLFGGQEAVPLRIVQLAVVAAAG